MNVDNYLNDFQNYIIRMPNILGERSYYGVTFLSDLCYHNLNDICDFLYKDHLVGKSDIVENLQKLVEMEEVHLVFDGKRLFNYKLERFNNIKGRNYKIQGVYVRKAVWDLFDDVIKLLEDHIAPFDWDYIRNSVLPCVEVTFDMLVRNIKERVLRYDAFDVIVSIDAKVSQTNLTVNMPQLNLRGNRVLESFNLFLDLENETLRVAGNYRK